MENKVIIHRKDFPEWLKESEFYLSVEDTELYVETWLLDEPQFDTVENIMHFLRIVDFCNVNIEPYMAKIKEFIKDETNYFALISLLSSRNYGIYKKLLEELEGPLFRIDVEGYIEEFNQYVGSEHVNVDLKIIIRHRNMHISFSLKDFYIDNTQWPPVEELFNHLIQPFTNVGDLLAGKLDVREIFTLNESESREPTILKLDKKYNMVSVKLIEKWQSNDDLYFLHDENKIGFMTESIVDDKLNTTYICFIKLRDLDIVKNEF
jgi:hypothetical protein